MKKVLSILLVLAMIIGFGACAAGGNENTAEETSALQVGFGREKLMPETITKVHLAGGDQASRRATGFKDFLYANCVAVRDSKGETVLIYNIDGFLTIESIFNPAKKTISAETGVKESNIMIANTHTHAAVSLTYNWDGLEAYREQYQKALVKAAQTALDDLADAEIYLGSTYADDLVFVRHYTLADGRKTSQVAAGSPEITGHPADKDAEVQIVRFARSAENKKDVVLVSFNSHPTFTEGGLEISADFPGPTREFIESNGDYRVAYFTGDAGNQEEFSKINAEDHGLDYREYGHKLGQYVIDAIPTLEKKDAGDIKFISQKYMGTSNKEKLDMIGKAREVIDLKNSVGIDAANALATEYGLYTYLEAGEIIARADYEEKRPLPFNVMSIGDALSFVFAPYEMFSESGSYIRANETFDMTFLVSCANGAEGYMPSAAALEYGCYEGYVTKYARGSAEEFADEFLRMLKELKSA